MAATLKTSLAWLGRAVGWSNSWQSWKERLALVMLLVGSWLLVWLRSAFEPGVLIALWSGLILASAVVLRRAWLILFGPVFFYDLVRTSRRNRHMLLRWSYAVLLALLIGWMYFTWESDLHGRQLDRNAVAELNARLFYVFMVIQLGTVLLVTPAYTAGAIAEEKERKTLEFLLATDLESREIVLGKMLARMLSIMMVVLAGLPILSSLQILGGVGPDLVLGGFAATLITIAGLSGLSVGLSAFTRTARDAVLLSYLAIFAYGILSVVVYLATRGGPPTSVWAVGFLGDLVTWTTCGNPLVSFMELMRAPGFNVSAALPVVLPRYMIFHGLLAVLCPAWASWRLRTMMQGKGRGNGSALTQPSRPLTDDDVPVHARRPVGRWPMVWKELHVESGFKFGGVVKIIWILVLAMLIVASFWSLIDMYQVHHRSSWGYFQPNYYLTEQANGWVRVVGTAVAMFMIVLVGVRAAGSIGSEKDRLTLGEILTTPITSREILVAKWIGALASVRWWWLWLGTIWGTAILMGGLSLWAIPCLVLVWFVIASGVASAGLWFSAHANSTLRAVIATLLVLLAVSIGPWLVMWLFCDMSLHFMDFQKHDMATLIMNLGLEAISPPAVLDRLAFPPVDLNGHTRWDPVESAMWTLFCLSSLILWTLGALVLSDRLVRRFPVLINRQVRKGMAGPTGK